MLPLNVIVFPDQLSRFPERDPAVAYPVFLFGRHFSKCPALREIKKDRIVPESCTAPVSGGNSSLTTAFSMFQSLRIGQSHDTAEAGGTSGFINALNDLSAGRVIPLPGAAPEDGKLRTMAGMRPLAARSTWNESGALAAHC